MTDRPRVLVTNDDGIESVGVRTLARALASEFDVILAAPNRDRSGSGTGIGGLDLDAGVELTPVDVPGVEAYSIDGPPGLAVTAAALGAFGTLPRLVFSGINAGINTGHSIIHSGTVGAALTANTFKMKGVAISLAQSDPWHWETAAEYAAPVARWILAHESPKVLNVNIPGVPPDKVVGVHWADLDEFGYIRVATADVEDRRLQFVVGSETSKSDPGTDTVLCSENHVTLTPLRSVEPAPFPSVAAHEIAIRESIVSG